MEFTAVIRPVFVRTKRLKDPTKIPLTRLREEEEMIVVAEAKTTVKQHGHTQHHVYIQGKQSALRDVMPQTATHLEAERGFIDRTSGVQKRPVTHATTRAISGAASKEPVLSSRGSAISSVSSYEDVAKKGIALKEISTKGSRYTLPIEWWGTGELDEVT